MALETVTTLEDSTVESLQDLVQINIDARDGFREASEKFECDDMRAAFLHFADERDRQADELLMYVERNEGDTCREGSYAAKFHRCWINTRAALSSDDIQVVLDEAERGEDVIKDAYESALKETAGSAVNDVLMSHMKQVKSAHDRVRDLRDGYRRKNS